MILIGEEFDSKIALLEQVKLDDDNWLVYYVDPETSEKWIEEYPNGSFHGGGTPQLRLVEKFPWEEVK